MLKRIAIVSCLGLVASCSAPEQPNSFVDYLEETSTPKLFYPGVVSIRDTIHYNSSFSDDGKTIVYTRHDEKKRSVASSQTFDGQTFTPPKPITDEPKYSYGDPHISANGKTVLLSSDRPDDLTESEGQIHSLWRFKHTQSGWAEPERLALEMDYVGGFGYPSLTADNTLYFQYFSTEDRNMDIFRANYKDGEYGKPEKLPPHISGAEFEGDPFIDRQERFIIFAGFNRDVNHGLSDLYISFKLDDGWSKVINLGASVNSHGYDGSPYVTPDDKYLIFTSSRHPEIAGEQERFNVFYTAFNLEKYRQMAQKAE